MNDGRKQRKKLKSVYKFYIFRNKTYHLSVFLLIKI